MYTEPDFTPGTDLCAGLFWHVFIQSEYGKQLLKERMFLWGMGQMFFVKNRCITTNS